jgi:cytochrome c peroxidase
MLPAVIAAVASSAPAAPPKTPAAPRPPLGLPAVRWPEENPYDPRKVELGRRLFFERRLSSDGSISCASCHIPEKAFTDGAPVSTGIGGRKGTRNAPTLINRAYAGLQFWDGRASGLEAQVREPLASALEMTRDRDPHAAHRACVERLRAVPGYVRDFAAVFGSGEITIERVARAIAAFERTILSGNSSFDRYRAGDRAALSAGQERGMELFFGKGACSGCHMGFNFSDGAYINTGIGMDRPAPDLGRYEVTRVEADRGAFKTPTLREIERTAPYMHDGSLKTLDEVVEHYDRGGIKNPWLDERMKPLNLSEPEKKDLVAFLKALSGEGWQHVRPPAAFPK